MATCLIGLGANLGDRRATLDRAVDQIGRLAGVRLLRASPWRSTHPIGGPSGQPDFLNGALLIESRLSPLDLLQQLHAIEDAAGRKRDVQWQSRTLDLDLLLFDQQISAGEPILPHPRMAFRRFVLDCACAIAPDLIHPTTGWTLSQLQHHLRETPPYIALCDYAESASGRAFASTLATALAGIVVFDSATPVTDSLPTVRGREDSIKSLSFWERAIETGFSEVSQAADRDQWVVSRFWSPKVVARAELFLAPNDFIKFRDKWSPRNPQFATPRFVVALTEASNTSESIDQAISAATLMSADQKHVLALEWKHQVNKLLTEPGRGPILHSTAATPDELLAEIVAAARASE